MPEPGEYIANTENTAPIPKIPRDKIIFREVLGEGMTGKAFKVKIQGLAPGFVVLKQPNPGIMAKAEINNELKVLEYLNKRGIEGVVKLLAKSVNFDKDPYLIKEYVPDFNFKEGDNLPFVPVSGHIDQNDPNSDVIKTRARWCWGMLNDVLEPVHKAGVVIADVKPDDLSLAEYKTSSGDKKEVVKCIDFGNSFLESDITQMRPVDKASDCFIFFKQILRHGLGINEIPRIYPRADMEDWLNNIKSKNPHPALLEVCTKYAESILNRTNYPYKDGQELKEVLEPYFNDLAAIKEDSGRKDEPAKDPLQLVYEITQGKFRSNNLLKIEQFIIECHKNSLSPEQAKWLFDAYRSYKRSILDKPRQFGSQNHQQKLLKAFADLRLRITVLV